MYSSSKLFAKKETTPTFLGLNVMRSQLQPDGKFSPWQNIYSYNAKQDRVIVSKGNETLLRESVLDSDNASRLSAFLQKNNNLK